MAVFKNRLATAFAAIALTALVLLLAGNVGLWLYNPPRLAPEAEASSCRLNILQGYAEVQTQDSITWKEAEDGMQLEPGSQVRTGEDSHALLTFSEGSTTKIGPNSDVLVATLEGSQENSTDVIVLKQKSGSSWNQVAKLPGNKQHRFEVQTPSASVLARGTLFLVNVDSAGKTVTQLTEGQIDVSAQNTLVHVFPGQQTEAAPGAPPSTPAPIPYPVSELIVTAGPAAIGMVIDPSGSSTGYLPDGSKLNQINGSSSSLSGESRHTTIVPGLSTGEYTVVLHSVAGGKADYTLEALSGGNRKFTYSGSYDATAKSEFLVRLRVDVAGNSLNVSVVGPDPPRGTAGSVAPASATVTGPGVSGAAASHPENYFRLLMAWGKETLPGYWVAGALLAIFLGAIYVWIHQGR